jgi:RNase P protein component
MRAIFVQNSSFLKSGSYVFVAKAGIFEASHEALQLDFKKVLKNAKTFT